MPQTSKSVMLFVLLSSLFLYVAGVGTGWYIGQTYYHSTSKKLNQLENQIKDLRSFSYAPSLCSYAEARYYMLLSSLGHFNLPYRLENAKVPNDVLDQYMSVESEAYLTGEVLQSSCNVHPHLILYFFKRDKPESLKAGKILDASKGKFIVLAFPVDTNSTVVNSLITYLNVTRYPAIYLCGKLIEWPFNITEVSGVEKECK